MTKQIAVVDASAFTTDAKFRTWGLAASTALQACGLVKTADTGQIDWATVTKPAVVTTQAGYEIYRFADALQSTVPVFIRIGYGTGVNASSPCTWLTVGTGTNGSGTITGPLATGGAVQATAISTASSATAMSMWFTHTANGHLYMNFGFTQATNNQANAGIWVVARTVNPSTGAATGAGLGVWAINRNNSAGSYHNQWGVDFNTATAFTTARNPATNLPNFAYSVASGSTVPLGKMFIPLATLFPTSSILSYYDTDITAFSTFSASPWGTTHTYMGLGAAALRYDYVNGNAITGAVPAVIWED